MTAEQVFIIAASNWWTDKLPTHMETDLKIEVLSWVPSWLKCTWCHFSFWLRWKIICFCLGLDLWSARAAAHSRDVSVGYRQRGPGQHQPECSDESNLILRATAVACSFCLSLQALPLLHTVPQTFTERAKPFFTSFFYLYMSSAHLLFFSKYSLPIPAAQSLPNNHTSTRHIPNETTDSVPVRLLSEGRAVFILFSFFLGQFEAFETEDSCYVAFGAVHNY